MKFFKKTVFWIIALAFVGGSFYLLDKGAEEKKAEREEARRLFKFTPVEVTAFTLKNEKGSVTAARQGGGWVLTSPRELPGDKKKIEGLLAEVVDAKLDAVLHEQPTEEVLTDMGLKPPHVELELVTEGGKTSAIFGDRGPTENISFAVVEGSPRVLRVHADIRFAADKDMYYLRDKTVFPFETVRARSFYVEWNKGERIEAAQEKEGKWNVRGIPEGKSDFLKIMNLLVLLRKSEIKAFEDDATFTDKRFGLTEPRVVLGVVDPSGVKYTLRIGSRDKKRRGVFASGGGKPGVFVLEEELWNAIPRRVTDLEAKEDAQDKQ